MIMNRFTILSLLFVSILTVASTMAVAEDDPVAIIHKFTDARARGDLDAALAFFADDAIIDGSGPCSSSPCVGKTAIRKWIIPHRGTNIVKASPTASYPSGSVVTQREESVHDHVRKAGLERVIYWKIYEVKSGKIVSIRAIRERTDPQTARFIKWHKERKRKHAH
jgi:ketosteroid isomerase-like protein